MREGGPDLLTIDHVVVAVGISPGRERSEIAAAAGLGIPGAPDGFAGEHFRQKLLLLLFRAIADDRGPDPGEAHEVCTESWRSPRRHLLFQDELLDDRASGATRFFGPGKTQVTCLAKVVIPLLQELGIPGVELGWEIAVQEAFDRVAKCVFLGAEIEVH